MLLDTYKGIGLFPIGMQRSVQWCGFFIGKIWKLAWSLFQRVLTLADLAVTGATHDRKRIECLL